MIRLFQPTMGPAELESVASVFADQWLGAGPRAKRFEGKFAEYIGAEQEQFIALTSCTEGLFQAIAALDLAPSDEVLIPAVSFIGAAHAVRAAGAQIRLTDVDPRTLNPSVEDLQRKVGSRTKAIVLLHFGGRLPWIQDIADLAKAENVILIEDSACSLGGRQDGRAYGTFGDIAVWSFDAMKLLVTGDGGMIRVSDARLRQTIAERANFGGTTPGLRMSDSDQARWWEVDPPNWGRNSRMNDLAAAIGLVQLGRMEEFIGRRRAIVETYDAALRGVSWLRIPPVPPAGSIPYFYWIQTAPETRDELALYLRIRDIYTTFRYWPLHRTTLYADGDSYPGAEAASDTTLLLPIHQNLSDDDVRHVIDAVLGFCA